MTISPRSSAGKRRLSVEAESTQSGQGRLHFFDFLTPEAQQDFEAMASRRQFQATERIYGQDDLHRLMFRIVSGRVWLSYSRPDGREHLSLLVGPGECFGFSSLVDGEGLPQSATARSEVHVQVLTKAALDQLRAKHRSVDDAMMRSMLRDIRILISHLSEATISDLPSRLAHRLLLYAVPDRSNQPVVRLTQSELAGVFGVSRQTVNKVLSDLVTQGLITQSYGQVRLQDVPRLRQLADGT